MILSTRVPSTVSTPPSKNSKLPNPSSSSTLTLLKDKRKGIKSAPSVSFKAMIAQAFGAAIEPTLCALSVPVTGNTIKCVLSVRKDRLE